MRAPFQVHRPFRPIWRRTGRIALGMAALLLLAQTVVAVHGVVHLARGEADHCRIALLAPALSGCAPASADTPDLPRVAAPPVTGGPIVLPASAPLRDHPVRAPPRAA